MGNTLSGLTPAQTFQGLIKVGNNTNVDGTLKVLSDGLGNDLPMEVSTSGVNFTGTLTQNGSPITGNPSGGAGLIQFSDGSAFASDSNLFWDNTNKYLGVGTSSPTKELTIDANSTDGGLIIRSQNDTTLFRVTKDGTSANTCELFQYSGGAINFAVRSATNASYFNNGTFTFGATSNLGAKVNIKGSGSTSATTALLVQNSSGTELLKVTDDNRLIASGVFETGTSNGFIFSSNVIQVKINGFISLDRSANRNFAIVDSSGFTNTYFKIQSNSSSNFADVSINGNHFTVKKEGQIIIGGSTVNASAILQVDSTTQGFLPPRMTTTQKNAISSPAAGLVVYDTDTNKLCCYNGTSWNDLF